MFKAIHPRIDPDTEGDHIRFSSKTPHANLRRYAPKVADRTLTASGDVRPWARLAFPGSAGDGCGHHARYGPKRIHADINQPGIVANPATTS
ncbi:hypothetical protein FAGKG844_190067 [Frankia sp. AgKG'84/4]